MSETNKPAFFWKPGAVRLESWTPPGGWDPRWSPADRWHACGLRQAALGLGYSEADAKTLAHIGVSLRIYDDVQFSDFWMTKWRAFLAATTATAAAGV